MSAKGVNRGDVGTTIPIAEAIEPGDRLLIAIAARTDSASTEDGKAIVGVRVQSSQPRPASPTICSRSATAGS